MDAKLKAKVLNAQRNEITEYIIYKKLAAIIKDKPNKEILEKISQDELSHYEFFKDIFEIELRRSNKNNYKVKELELLPYYSIKKGLCQFN